jgi:hypothetical protein
MNGVSFLGAVGRDCKDMGRAIKHVFVGDAPGPNVGAMLVVKIISFSIFILLFIAHPVIVGCVAFVLLYCSGTNHSTFTYLKRKIFS